MAQAGWSARPGWGVGVSRPFLLPFPGRPRLWLDQTLGFHEGAPGELTGYSRIKRINQKVFSYLSLHPRYTGRQEGAPFAARSRWLQSIVSRPWTMEPN